jgi:hypothetical protein
VEPRGQRIPSVDCTGTTDEHQEGCLERVVGRMAISECPATDAQDHRTVPLDHRSECQLRGSATTGDEPLKKLAVAQAGDRPNVEE